MIICICIKINRYRNDLARSRKSFKYKKLSNKNCDWIIANDVSNKKIGFSSDFNEVTVYYSDKKKEKLSYKKKSEISDEIVDRIINQLN